MTDTNYTLTIQTLVKIVNREARVTEKDAYFSFDIVVDPKWKITQLKDTIESITSIKPVNESQAPRATSSGGFNGRLVYAGRGPEDGKTIEECKIGSGSTIYWTVPKLFDLADINTIYDKLEFMRERGAKINDTVQERLINSAIEGEVNFHLSQSNTVMGSGISENRKPNT